MPLPPGYRVIRAQSDAAHRSVLPPDQRSGSVSGQPSRPRHRPVTATGDQVEQRLSDDVHGLVDGLERVGRTGLAIWNDRDDDTKRHGMVLEPGSQDDRCLRAFGAIGHDPGIRLARSLPRRHGHVTREDEGARSRRWIDVQLLTEKAAKDLVLATCLADVPLREMHFDHGAVRAFP